VIEAPLLIETDLDKLVDEVWVVDVPEEIQVRRLMERDGLNFRQAEDRVHSQMPLSEKKKFADVIIDNSGSPRFTRDFVWKLWKERVIESGVESIDQKNE